MFHVKHLDRAVAISRAACRVRFLPKCDVRGLSGLPCFFDREWFPGRRWLRGLERILDAAEPQHLGENCTDSRREGRIGAQCPKSCIRSSRFVSQRITRFGCSRSGRRRAGKPFLASCLFKAGSVLQEAFDAARGGLETPGSGVSRLFGGGRMPEGRPRGVAPVEASCAKEEQEQMFHVKHLDRAGGVGGTRLGGRAVRGAAPGGRGACAADAGGSPCAVDARAATPCAAGGPAHAAGAGCVPRLALGIGPCVCCSATKKLAVVYKFC